MWLSLRQMKILVKFLHLWEDYEGISIEDYEKHCIGNTLVLAIYLVICLSLLNQVLILSNSCQLSMDCKNFTTAKKFNTVRCVTTLCRNSKVCMSSLYHIHRFHTVWEVTLEKNYNNLFFPFLFCSFSSWKQ